MKHVKSISEHIQEEEFIIESFSTPAFIILKKFKKNSRIIFDEKIKSEVKRYIKGSKTEFKESGEFIKLFRKYMKREKLSKKEKKFLIYQGVDILKMIGIVIPFQVLFPLPVPMVGTVILILLEYVFRKMGIKILPNAFYEKEKPELNKQVEEYIEN